MSISSLKTGVVSPSSLLAGNAPYIPSDYESIATVTVGSGGQSSITFSSIPSTYQHLQIRGIDCGQTGSDYGYSSIRINSDSGANYSRHLLWGTGAAANAYGDSSQSLMQIIRSSLTSTYFAGVIIDVLDYANTNKNKTVRVLSGVDQNGAGSVTLGSSVWQSTSAVSSITILPNTLFQQYTSYALYGIRG
jgi:hypothetical protein